jgi:hypothetical protein
LKKKSLKNNNIFKIEAQSWAPGDLVKIKSSTWAGRVDAALGLVVKEIRGAEANLFPYALVYDIHQQEIKQFYLYDLELISGAS